MYLVKDIKHADIHAKLFSTKYIPEQDIALTRSDLVFDSFVLGDFYLISGPALFDTAMLQSLVNGITLFPLAFWYAMMTDEYKSVDIITCIKSFQSYLYNKDNTLMILNLVVIIGFLLSFLASHSVSFYLGKTGETQKLRQLSLTLGAPLFLTIFMTAYLRGVSMTLDCKTLVEIVIIAIAYVETHDIECAGKEEVKTRGVLSKVLQLSHSRDGDFTEYYQTRDRAAKIAEELGSSELQRVAGDLLIQQDMTVMMHSGSNVISFREHMDPMFNVRTAEWGGLYPSSMLDVQAGRWKDEGQNDKNVDEQTRAKIAKMPIIFD